jgi:hypothetical protein
MCQGAWDAVVSSTVRLQGTQLNTLREAVAYLAKTVPKAARDMPAAPDEARRLPPGPERTEALDKTGQLRNAADSARRVFSSEKATQISPGLTVCPKVHPPRGPAIRIFWNDIERQGLVVSFAETMFSAPQK